jgi:hypothetical protein
MRSIDPRPKCGGEKPHKGRSPTAVFRSPSRLLAAKHIQPVKRCFFAPTTRPPPAMDGGRRAINAFTFIFYAIIILLFYLWIIANKIEKVLKKKPPYGGTELKR